jgi:hypothetical protein
MGQSFILVEKIIDIKKQVLKVSFIEFETYGDFAMEKDQLSGYHNAATVILAFPY